MTASETLRSWVGRKMLTQWCIYWDQEGCGPWLLPYWAACVPLGINVIKIMHCPTCLLRAPDPSHSLREWRLTDVRLHSWMSHWADLCQWSWLCRQLSAPYSWNSQIWAGIRLRTREFWHATCSYFFLWVWDPTALSIIPVWTHDRCVIGEGSWKRP